MELSCPISAERVNENVVRIIAFIVAVIATTCVVFSNYWAIVFLIFDFALRAFTTGKFSLLKFIAIKIADGLSLSPKMKDLAPKKFAATLGFGFCLLESLFAICVGCYVYSFLQIFTKKNEA